MRKRLRFLLFEAHTTVLEMALSLELLCVGLWFLNPLYDTFSSAVSYAMMRNIASENAWGLACVLSSAFHLYGLVSQKRFARYVWLSLSNFLWLVMGVSFYVSNPQALGALLFILNALGCLLCLMRPEKKTSDV